MINGHGLKPKKKFGQHFLTDRAVLLRIADACALQAQDTVIEIGAGTGQLTTLLGERARRVIAIEKDRDLIPKLHHACAHLKTVEIVNQDVLRFDLADFGVPRGYILVGNIPYYITGKIIELALEQWPAPKRIVFTVQKEVAERICAKPGQLSILGVLTQALALPTIVKTIPRGAFSPPPKVDSAILELVPRDHIPERQFALMKNAVKAGFSHPRKLCASNLASHYGLQRSETEYVFMQCGVSSSARAQDLTLEQWIKISTLLKPLSA